MVQTNVAEIIDYGLEYGSICLCLSIGMLCQFCFERLLQATGRTSLAMATQLLGALVNILLDPILIFGLLGMPRLEVAGAAIATVTGQIIAAAVAIILNCAYRLHAAERKIDAKVRNIGQQKCYNDLRKRRGHWHGTSREHHV